MRDVFNKLRVKIFMCRFYVEVFLFNMMLPFKIIFECVKRYWILRKIEKESKDSWERHSRIRELKNEDKIKSRRREFFYLKAQLIGAFYNTIILPKYYVVAQESPNEISQEDLNNLPNYRVEFQKNKEELITLLKKFDSYEEINFDDKIKVGIIDWGFEDFKTSEELDNWEKNFAKYITELDII